MFSSRQRMKVHKDVLLILKLFNDPISVKPLTTGEVDIEWSACKDLESNWGFPPIYLLREGDWSSRKHKFFFWNNLPSA
jgi:hypothetical protein